MTIKYMLKNKEIARLDGNVGVSIKEVELMKKCLATQYVCRPKDIEVVVKRGWCDG